MNIIFCIYWFSNESNIKIFFKQIISTLCEKYNQLSFNDWKYIIINDIISFNFNEIIESIFIILMKRKWTLKRNI